MMRFRQRLFAGYRIAFDPRLFGARRSRASKACSALNFFEIGICNPSAFVYKRRTPAEPLHRPLLLGNSSMVEQRTLTPSILVRIQVPQPILARSP